MVIPTTTNNPPSFSGAGDGGKDFNSFVRLDMKTLSQSDLFSLSRSSSYAFDPKFDVTPNIDSRHRSTTTTTTAAATHRRIFAFSHRRGPRRRTSGSDGDAQVTENMLILNSLDRLIDMDDTNPREARKRKRKRKSKNENDEFECLGVIEVNEEVIDLRFLARDADGAFESELNRMTEGMEREDEFLGFLNGLEGRWGSSRKRRKYVDAAVFVKALPVNWKILLSLRPRVRRPSLYCRRFVSPSDVHFNSCKEVAFYLKSQFVTNTANPPEESAMMRTVSDCQMDLETGATIPTSSHTDLQTEVLGTCKDPFTSTVGLESHLQKYHGNDTRLDMDALTTKRSGPRGLLLVREPKYQPPIIQNSADAGNSSCK
ncbi:hypothetical protein SSX86_021007 [Deinandra increscens subsp. villosa]|uniref:MBD domain-containing protein n=1 Tax=Deinandra increscens subsp. villosa TaxID=3103831 RepID=A0AAP0CTH2_9ASTR